MTVLAPTGSGFLDALIGGGIPRGASVILQGPPGEEKETIAWRFLKDGWDRGEAAIVALSSTSPRRFRERLAALGVDAKAVEGSGRLVIIDWFSHREEAITDVKDEGSVLKVSVDLTNVGVAVNWALSRIPEGALLRAVFEVMSPALIAYDLRQVFLFAQVTKARLERRDGTALFLIEKEMHDPATLSNIEQPFDGVIDIERVREGDRIVRKISVPAMRGLPMSCTKYVPFEIDVPEATRPTPPAATPTVAGPKPEPAGPVSVPTSVGEESGDERIAAFARAAEGILAKDPRNLDALFAKAATLARAGRWEAALASLNDVTRIEVRYPGVWVLKAKLYEQLGKPKIAASCRERAMELQGKERLSEIGTGPASPAPPGEPRTAGKPPTPVPRVPPGVAPRRDARTKGLTTEVKRATLVRGGRHAPELTSGRTNGLVNGLASARAFVADGLTNGSGFTNGLGGVRLPREVRVQRWKLFFIPVIVFALLIAPLLAPEDLHGTLPIAIDGNFADWPASSFLAMQANPQLAPGIDVVRLGIMDNQVSLAFYVEVAGAALLGGGTGPGTMDTIMIFIDADGSARTGYDIAGLGADRMIEVSGVNGDIRVSQAWEFDLARGPRDWNGWTKPVGIPAAVQGSRLELAVDWLLFDSNGTAVSAGVRTRSWDGQVDEGDAAIALDRGTLLLVQQSQAPEVLSGVSVPLLSIAASAGHQAITFDMLSVRTLGTAPSSASAIRLLDSTGRELSAWIPALGDVRFAFTPETIPVGATVAYTVVGDFSGGSGGTFGVQISPADPVGTAGAVVTVRDAPAARFLGYAGFVPAGPHVDGGFAEWTASALDPAGDPGIRGNANVDVRNHAVLANGSSLYLYGDVEGRIFAGTPVPQSSQAPPEIGTSVAADFDRDTVPDAVDPFPNDFDNDGTSDAEANGDVDRDGITDYGFAGGTDQWLNATIPAAFPAPYAGKSVTVYIGPNNRPVVIGDDVLRFFFDTDNRTLSGFAIAGLGADRMIELRGTNGVVTQSAVLAFNGSFPGDWAWRALSPVTVATGYQAIELAVPFTASAVYLEAGDFWGGVDTTSPAPARASAGPSINAGNFGAGAKTSFEAAPAPQPLRVPWNEAGPRVTGSPNPPQILDISGNDKYYLRDDPHATENACGGGRDKVATKNVQGSAPVNQLTLSTGQSACWYLDATTGTTIPAGSWESLLDVSLSASYDAKVGAFNIGTGSAGTTVPVTVGFQPKVAIFWWSGRTESTDTAGTANHQRGFGVAISTTDRRAVCSRSQDAQASGVADSGQRVDAAICSMADGAFDGWADVSSIDANGFTLVIDDAFATDLRIHYLALGGSSLTNVATGIFTELASTGDQDITTVGFQPDAVIFLSAMIGSDAAGTNVDSQFMLGFAAGTGNPNEVVWTGASDDIADPTDTASYHRSGEAIARLDTFVDGVCYRAQVSAWLSNGFRLNYPESCGGTRRVHYLALKGGSYVIGDLLTSTTTGATITESGFGFSPKAALFVSHNKAQSTVDTAQNHDEVSIGAFSSTTARGAQCVLDEFGVADTDVGTAVEHDQVYCNLDTNMAVEGLMGIQTVDSDGFTLVMDDQDPAASFVGYIAFGADVDYGVYLEIWNKDTDSVRATIGSCLGQTAAGDDRQCLVSGVAEQTAASNEVVRIRVVHSGSTGTVSIDYDDADTTGDSRVTIPTGIPEFEEVVLPALSTVLVPVAWQWSQRRRRRGRRSGGGYLRIRSRLSGFDALPKGGLPKTAAVVVKGPAVNGDPSLTHTNKELG